jgi:uncharacterized UPF0160 family protein
MRIITHSGRFHADDVFAVMILITIFEDAKIIRTRDKKILSEVTEDDIVVDIGGVYDQEEDRFDHHQKDFNECWRNSSIQMAAAGLVWKKYAIPYLILKIGARKIDIIRKLRDQLYYEFIQEIDAIDNGLKQSDSLIYNIKTGISSVIAKYNYSNSTNHEEQEKRFIMAMRYMNTLFNVFIQSSLSREAGYKKDGEWIMKCIKEMNNGIVILDRESKTFDKCRRKYEKENEDIKVKFVIYPKDEEGYRLNAITKKWPDIRYKISHEEDLIKNGMKKEAILFVHKGQFIASFKDLNSAKKAAIISLNTK